MLLLNDPLLLLRADRCRLWYSLHCAFALQQ
jgi:hypothetical protein